MSVGYIDKGNFISLTRNLSFRAPASSLLLNSASTLLERHRESRMREKLPTT